MSRETLARDAAVKLTVAGLPAGACTRRGRLWSVLEKAHRRATNPAESQEVIAAIREEFCDGCPALLGCHKLATVGEYTGLAAGAAYEEGQRQEAHWTAPKPGPRRREAS
ncbi:hypothetical protein [Nocardioides sp.]|uniref:hypothetical protein n=1 Tax=Nocardioides sp. TaxID=35761 RepID=UPI002733A4CF|nr:hypothetical protein [Nocardioides sp.]MDP3889835.1 hypothetical protein [Nocardioides sp.]